MITLAFLVIPFAVMLVGIFGILTRRNIIKILLAVNILETGVNLLVVALGYFPGANAPIITAPISATHLPFVDPLPQALVLTSIVIGLGTTALGLAITLRYFARRRSLEFVADEEDGRPGADTRPSPNGEPVASHALQSTAAKGVTR